MSDSSDHPAPARASRAIQIIRRSLHRMLPYRSRFRPLPILTISQVFALTLIAMAIGAIVGSPITTATAFAVAMVAEIDYVLRRRRSLGAWARGLDVRMARRIPLALAALAALPDRFPVVVVALLALASVALSRALRTRPFQMDSTVQLRALGGLEVGTERLRLCGHLGRQRDTFDIWLRGLEATVVLAFALTAQNIVSNWVGWAAVAAAAMLVLSRLTVTVLRIRRVRPAMLQGLHNQEIIEAWREYDPEILLYYNGHPNSMYGLRVWLPVLSATPWRVGIICRHRSVKSLATDVPGVRVIQDQLIEDFVTPSTRLALYPATSTLNVHLQRDVSLTHCFIGHGDSDKAGSASPVTRSYDEVWVAGQAGIDRYSAAGVEIPAEKFVEVGRPSLSPRVRLLREARLEQMARERDDDAPRHITLFQQALADSQAAKVMYAPTWEGYFEASNYSSLELFAPALASWCRTSEPDRDLLFRPHPMTGHRDKAQREARDDLRAAIREQHGDERGRALYRFTNLAIEDWFDGSDVLIADVSSVVSDWLAWDRPLIVTNPTGLDLDDFHEQFPTSRAAYVASSPSELFDMVDLALTTDPMQDQRRAVKRYYIGDDSDPLDRWQTAISRHVARKPSAL